MMAVDDIDWVKRTSAFDEPIQKRLFGLILAPWECCVAIGD